MITTFNEGSATQLTCDRCKVTLQSRFHSPSQHWIAKSLLVGLATIRGWHIEAGEDGVHLCVECFAELKDTKIYYFVLKPDGSSEAILEDHSDCSCAHSSDRHRARTDDLGVEPKS